MAKNYYYVVSSFVEHSPNSSPKGFAASELRDEIAEQVDIHDREYIRLLYTFYDIENLISRYNGKTTYNPLGNLTPEELDAAEAGIDLHGFEGSPTFDNGNHLPESLQSVVNAYRRGEEFSGDDIDTAKTYEKNLWEAYYSRCEKSDCRFIREYMHFDRTLRNISTAFIARRTGLPIAQYLIGSDDVTAALAHSSALDFGLRGEIEYVENIIALLESNDLLEKEHDLDQIRWEKAEELTVFDYFSINRILAYMVKANIIQRWISLDYERGQIMLERMLSELSDCNILTRAEEDKTN